MFPRVTTVVYRCDLGAIEISFWFDFIIESYKSCESWTKATWHPSGSVDHFLLMQLTTQKPCMQQTQRTNDMSRAWINQPLSAADTDILKVGEVEDNV